MYRPSPPAVGQVRLRRKRAAGGLGCGRLGSACRRVPAAHLFAGRQRQRQRRAGGDPQPAAAAAPHPGRPCHHAGVRVQAARACAFWLVVSACTRVHPRVCARAHVCVFVCTRGAPALSGGRNALNPITTLSGLVPCSEGVPISVHMHINARTCMHAYSRTRTHMLIHLPARTPMGMCRPWAPLSPPWMIASLGRVARIYSHLGTTTHATGWG